MIYSWVESWEIMAFIYVITNDINGKQYVGKTNHNIEKRFKEHINDSRRERCEKRPLYNAINKYGIEHFSISVLEECSVEDSANREIYWINRLQTYGRNGYNATRGGDSKKYYDYKEIAIKYQELLSEKETADYFHCDIATVKQACCSQKIRMLNSSEVNKNKYGKKIVMCDMNSGEQIKIFNTIKEAALYLGNLSYSHHIGEVANGIRKTAYGYKWIYVKRDS